MRLAFASSRCSSIARIGQGRPGARRVERQIPGAAFPFRDRLERRAGSRRASSAAAERRIVAHLACRSAARERRSRVRRRPRQACARRAIGGDREQRGALGVLSPRIAEPSAGVPLTPLLSDPPVRPGPRRSTAVPCASFSVVRRSRSKRSLRALACRSRHAGQAQAAMTADARSSDGFAQGALHFGLQRWCAARETPFPRDHLARREPRAWRSASVPAASCPSALNSAKRSLCCAGDSRKIAGAARSSGRRAGEVDFGRPYQQRIRADQELRFADVDDAPGGVPQAVGQALAAFVRNQACRSAGVG